MKITLTTIWAIYLHTWKLWSEARTWMNLQHVILLWHYVWMSVWVSISTRPVQLPVLFSRCFLSQLRKRLPAFIRLSFPPLFPALPTHTIRSLHQSGPLCQTWSLPVVHWFGFEKRIKQFPPTLWCGPYLRFLLTLAGLCCY